MRHRFSILRFLALAVGMGAAMTSALGDPAVGFAVGVGTAVALSGHSFARCRATKTGESG